MVFINIILITSSFYCCSYEDFITFGVELGAFRMLLEELLECWPTNRLSSVLPRLFPPGIASITYIPWRSRPNSGLSACFVLHTMLELRRPYFWNPSCRAFGSPSPDSWSSQECCYGWSFIWSGIGCSVVWTSSRLCSVVAWLALEQPVFRDPIWCPNRQEEDWPLSPWCWPRSSCITTIHP